MTDGSMNGGNKSMFLLDDGRLRSGWRFLFSLVVVIAMNFVAGTLAASFGDARPRLEDLIYRPLLALLLLISYVGMARIFDQPEGNLAEYLGLPSRSWFRDSLAGALLGFVLIFIAVVVIAVFFDYHITRIVLNPHTLRIPLAIVVIIMTGAMAEELMFRGYPFQRLVDSIGKVGAILVLSVLFGAVHLRNPHVSDNRAVQVFAFANTLLMGVVFALGYLRTRALWLPWGLHFSWNLTMGVIFGLPVSGIAEFSVLVRARVRGPAWLLGGPYGLEGGLLGTLIMLMGLVYVLGFVPSRPENARQYLDEVPPAGIQPSGQPELPIRPDTV